MRSNTLFLQGQIKKALPITVAETSSTANPTNEVTFHPLHDHLIARTVSITHTTISKSTCIRKCHPNSTTSESPSRVSAWTYNLPPSNSEDPAKPIATILGPILAAVVLIILATTCYIRQNRRSTQQEPLQTQTAVVQEAAQVVRVEAQVRREEDLPLPYEVGVGGRTA